MFSMKRGWVLFLLILVCAGCALGPQTSNRMEGEGYILEVAEDRVLVLDEPFANQSWTDIMEDYDGEAIWLNTRTPNLKPGQKSVTQSKAESTNLIRPKQMPKSSKYLRSKYPMKEVSYEPTLVRANAGGSVSRGTADASDG
ncbi:hypothetical protein HMSSN139_12290 [Paenibacillus sp. HMSSN-139]|nr:hypothetical protein HMSSN139_12290 [Paenibacillus sp. HMSSN-139]